MRHFGSDMVPLIGTASGVDVSVSVPVAVVVTCVNVLVTVEPSVGLLTVLLPDVLAVMLITGSCTFFGGCFGKRVNDGPVCAPCSSYRISTLR